MRDNTYFGLDDTFLHWWGESHDADQSEEDMWEFWEEYYEW